MSEDLLRVASGKQDGKFFAANPVRLSPTANTGEPGCYEPKHLVPAIVAVGIVDALEVVNINRGDCIGRLQGGKGIVECAPRTETGEFVPVGEGVRVLNDATGEYQPRSCEIGGTSPRRPSCFQRNARRQQRPEHPVVNGL